MPELPEVEVVTRALRGRVSGLSIVKVEVFSPSMRTPIEPLKHAGIEGREIVRVRRRGRYIVMELDGNLALLMHLGMSGVLRVEPQTVEKRKHEHIFFHLSDSSILRFECTRRFSLCKVCTLNESGWPEELVKLGMEPLTADFTPEYFFAASRKYSGSVKTFLMDNAVQVGVGNIYAAEVLFSSGVSPLRKARDLTQKEAERLVTEIKSTLERAIEAGGSTIHDYRHLDGGEGKFSRQLKVYGKVDEKCPACGTIIEKVAQSGRSSYFCPKCQK